MRRPPIPAPLLAAVLLIGTAVPATSAAMAAGPVTPAEGPECGVGTGLPETGLQGEVPVADQISGRALDGYRCGIDIIGHDDLGGQQYNANMAWVDDCAYVGTAGQGVTVVDVSDPHAPADAGQLRGHSPLDRPQDWGTDLTLETLGAWESGDDPMAAGYRALLAIGRYGNPPSTASAPMDLYDVRECATPRYLGTYSWPENIHNLTFSPDGTRIWATLPLAAVDISGIDPDAPAADGFRSLGEPEVRFLGTIDDQLQAEAEAAGDFDKRWRSEFLSHEAWEVREGDRDILYVGGQTPANFDTFWVVDVTEWAEPDTDVPAELISMQTGSRGHSVRHATIDGERYILHSEESIVDPTAKGCVDEYLNPIGGAAQPYLTPVTGDVDAGAPEGLDQDASVQIRLEINEPEHCPTQMADRMNSSVHYHDVDDAADTHFALLSMWNSGLRIVDVQDPANPAEVAYFNPGAVERLGGDSMLDVAWGHIRHRPETGEIWLTTAHGGFWVLRLQPEVYGALGMQPPADHVGLPSAPVTPTTPPLRDLTAGPAAAYYCTLDISAATSAGAAAATLARVVR